MDGHQEALIDLGAIKDNVSALVKHVGGAQLMAVVKSDGYGHGMIPAAAAAVAGGADWLGVVHVADALALRDAGFTVPVLCLLASPDAPHEQAIRRDIDLSAGSVSLVGQIAAAAQRAGRPARLHLKVDTGMARGGATEAEWPGVVRAALEAEAAGHVRIIGIWSHLACADIPGHPSIVAQLEAFRGAIGAGGVRWRPAAAAPPGQHAGHADPAGHLVRPGQVRRRGRRPVHAAWRRAGLAAPGDDRPGSAHPGQAGPGGHRRLLRAPVRDRAARPPSA